MSEHSFGIYMKH
ncbi:Protein of unknown function [Bacillus mobilis]|nr:Protein of unknown function [Bacillus mobilis]